jgi:hypothetical protein
MDKQRQTSPKCRTGKKVSITTDPYQLIVGCQVMNQQSDSDIIVAMSDGLPSSFKQTGTWSFDKGYRHPDYMSLLKMVVPDVIMPKKGKCNRTELAREHQKVFKKCRNKHGAIESNIHSLETRSLFRFRIAVKSILIDMSLSVSAHITSAALVVS